MKPIKLWELDAQVDQNSLTWIRLIMICYIFQEGLCSGYLWDQNQSVSPILNLQVATLRPTKFQPNQTYCMGVNVVWRFLRWPAGGSILDIRKKTFSNSKSPCHSNASDQVSAQSHTVWKKILFEDFQTAAKLPYWLLEWDDFNNSKSTCCPNASHQFSAPSILRFERRCCFEEFQDGHPGYLNGIILAILNLHAALMPSSKFWFNPTHSSGSDVVWRVSRWLPWWPSWISEQNDFSNSESPCRPNVSHQVFTQSDLVFQNRCGQKIFKMASMVAILDIQTEQL